MTATAEIVTLVVDGLALQGWQSVRVMRSVEAAAISFNLGATNPAWSSDAGRLRKSALVEILTTPDGGLGSFIPEFGELLVTGYVDTYESSAGPGASRSVTVNGRSKPADAIDCEPVNHPTGAVENQDLVGVAKGFDEWGLTFRTDATLDKIPTVQRTPGEPLFQTLERESRRLGLLMMGEPDGSVLITKGAKGRAAGGLVEGQSPLVGFTVSDQMRLAYSEVVVRGQQALGVDDKALRQEEKATAPTYGRHRPLILFNEGSNVAPELKRRADWELRRRNGARLSVMARVASWRDGDGELWAPRKLIPVEIPSEEIAQDFAIRSVVFTQTVGEGEGSGTSADLVLAHPDTLGDPDSGAAA